MCSTAYHHFAMFQLWPWIGMKLLYKMIETLPQIPTSHPRDPATIKLDLIKAEVIRTAHLLQCLWPKRPITRDCVI